MRLFVTVGSTRFDLLVSHVTSPDFLTTLSSMHYDEITVQYGGSEPFFRASVAHTGQSRGEIAGPRNPVVAGYAYNDAIRDDMEVADLIISHAGSGSILESLRLQKPLIVVANETLMDNHQDELAEALQEEGYLVYSTCSRLLEALRDQKYLKVRPFPAPDPSLFAAFLDEQMKL